MEEKLRWGKEEYEWVEINNAYGYTHRYPKLENGTLLERVREPYRNQVVLKVDGQGAMVPVLITAGQYRSNGRLSNYWYWKPISEELKLGEKESGYGGFYRPPYDIQVKEKIELSIR